MQRRQIMALATGAAAAAFVPFTGAARQDRAPTGYLRTNWSRDPFSAGSYSYVAAGSSRRDHAALAEPVGGRLFFAGEAAHPWYNGTVHAAYEAGQIAADAVFDTDAETIGIIGAGISGLAAADLLLAEGYEVTVLEARDRMGGRVWTDTSLGAPLDLGASWIHGTTDNPLTGLARGLGAQTRATGETVAFRSRAGQSMAEEDTPGWLEEVLSIQHTFGARETDINHAAYAEDDDYDGEDVIFPGGYAQLLDAFSPDIPVLLSRIVTGIDMDRDGVRVTGPGGLDLAFDAVIVTVPLGVLKSGAIRFSPALPQAKQSAIARLGMGLLDKLYLRYDRVFWDRDVTWIATPENGLPRGQFNQWLNLYPYLSEPVILAFNGAEAARTLAALPDAEIVTRAHRTLSGAYG